MTYIYDDKKYNKIVEDILYDNRFNKIKNEIHHGVTRYDHSLKVSFYSYKISKFLKLDYESTARAALLHDYFLNIKTRKLNKRIASVLNHPKKSLENAKKDFNVNFKEANIIEAHMFFLNPTRVPKYLESWIVIFADTIVATFEFGFTFQKKAVNYAGLALLFLRNYI